jgi:hypothetical protein
METISHILGKVMHLAILPERESEKPPLKKRKVNEKKNTTNLTPREFLAFDLRYPV